MPPTPSEPTPAPDTEPTPVAPALPESPATPSPAPDPSGAGIVPEGFELTAADNPAIDSTVSKGAEDLGPVVWMEHDGVEGKTRTTQVQFDTVWAPRGWTLTDAPVEEVGSIPGT